MAETVQLFGEKPGQISKDSYKLTHLQVMMLAEAPNNFFSSQVRSVYEHMKATSKGNLNIQVVYREKIVAVSELIQATRACHELDITGQECFVSKFFDELDRRIKVMLREPPHRILDKQCRTEEIIPDTSALKPPEPNEEPDPGRIEVKRNETTTSDSTRLLKLGWSAALGALSVAVLLYLVKRLRGVPESVSREETEKRAIAFLKAHAHGRLQPVSEDCLENRLCFVFIDQKNRHSITVDRQGKIVAWQKSER